MEIIKFDVNILILGETGTGKDMFASAIHHASDRKHKRFVHLNCSTIPSSLLEAELYGHLKGAFTDAKENKSGILEYIKNGTLLFDEIAEASLNIQAKLLRLIENREARKLGDCKIFNTNVRFIFSTNKELFEEIKKEKFRKDLYYRINTLRIFIPPLRERKDDILLLIDYILKRESNENKLKLISQEAINKLLSYDYPGNIRELNNIIKRAVVFSNNVKICASDILFDINTIRDHKTKRMINYDDLQRILKKHNFNRTKSAKELGISRQWLHKLIKKTGYDNLLNSI